MIRNLSLSNGIWARVKRTVIWPLRSPTDDAVGNIVRFDKSDVLASLDGQGNGLYLANSTDIAKQRAAFSQHIGC
jgi:hypothetical protein